MYLISRYKRTFIVLIIFSFMFIYGIYNWSTTRLIFRDFAYITRPIWDSGRPKPWNAITHYYADGLKGEQLCEQHKWHKRTNKPKIIDAVIFSVELDLLEIRMKELWPFVDLFIVLEADKTFTGKPKRLSLNESLDTFVWAKEKLHHEVYTGLVVLKSGENPFKNENKMRDQMESVIKKFAKDEDIIICSDVDEIPSSNTIELLKECEGFPDNMHLQLKTYIYSFEYFYSIDDSWRAHINVYNKSIFTYSHQRRSDYILADSGWHCTFCFRNISDFIFKMTSYSHNDRVTKNQLLDKKQIQRKICNGEDVFDMYPEVYTIKELIIKFGAIPKTTSMTDLPKHLIQNANKFSFLLPNGCVREDSVD